MMTRPVWPTCEHCHRRIYGLAEPGRFGGGWAHHATRRERCDDDADLRRGSTVAAPATPALALDRSPRARRSRAGVSGG